MSLVYKGIGSKKGGEYLTPISGNISRE